MIQIYRQKSQYGTAIIQICLLLDSRLSLSLAQYSLFACSLARFIYATFLTQRPTILYAISLTRDNDAIRPVVVAAICISSWLRVDLFDEHGAHIIIALCTYTLTLSDPCVLSFFLVSYCKIYLEIRHSFLNLPDSPLSSATYKAATRATCTYSLGIYLHAC